jgi:hypothetical protein
MNSTLDLWLPSCVGVGIRRRFPNFTSLPFCQLPVLPVKFPTARMGSGKDAITLKLIRQGEDAASSGGQLGNW